jgi:glycosyltransferase involved in cell wall biosynthesis
MHYPKISIVTPAYNSQHLITDTIESVLSQGYPNLEYIIIDGGSTDGTAQVIERYAAQLSYWHSQPDAGQYDAINQGFAKATGEIMCWLNADDMFLPRSLFVVGEIFAQLPEVEWLSSLQPATWDANGFLAGTNALPGFSREAFLDGLYLPTTAKKGYWLQQESTFWRRSLWDKVGAQIPKYDLAGDFALWTQFYEHANLVGLTYPLGGFRMIEGQRSEDHQAYLVQATTALEIARKRARWSPSIATSLLYSKGNDIPRLSQILKSRYGYIGSEIQKVSPRSMNSGWQILEKRFLP